ncbi:hypothetical protein ABPG75_008800 [Micractinium tetrahymenae]
MHASNWHAADRIDAWQLAEQADCSRSAGGLQIKISVQTVANVRQNRMCAASQAPRRSSRPCALVPCTPIPFAVPPLPCPRAAHARRTRKRPAALPPPPLPGAAC